MGLSDRLRAWLRGDTGRGAHPAAGGRRRTDRSASRGGDDGLAELERFARSRRGVEAYLEPRTNIYGLSVLLVADDGEYLRRPVPDESGLRRLCARLGMPLYDARRVGYPRRVRDFVRGVRPEPVELGDLPPWPGTDDDAPPPPPPRDPTT